MECKIKTEVIEEILKEKEKHQDLEFGGWVIVDNDEIVDVVFDIKSQTYGDVVLDCKEILKLDKDIQKKVKGFHHFHPIVGLSATDIDAMNKLTNLWGKCYMLTLQGNGDISIHINDKEKGLIYESWFNPMDIIEGSK